MKLFISIILCAVVLSSGVIAGEMDIFEAIHSRRSVREYKSDPVPKEDIEKLLDAARMAPTSGNQQPWKFLVITEGEQITKLKDACIAAALDRYKDDEEYHGEEAQIKLKKRAGEYYAKVFSAPVYIVVLTDTESKYPTYNVHDGPLAAGYLMLAARALGYGTVYMTDSISEDITRTVLGIPDRYKRVCITPLGVPVEWPETPAKKDLSEFIVYESMVQ
jgi:nitroreductase